MKAAHPHKSLTHEEKFFHIGPIGTNKKSYNGATVFMRREDDFLWYASVALCSSQDQFCRRTGRSAARRNYFAGKRNALHAPGGASQLPTTRLTAEKLMVYAVAKADGHSLRVITDLIRQMS